MSPHTRRVITPAAILFTLLAISTDSACKTTGDRATPAAPPGDAPNATSGAPSTNPHDYDAAPRERPAAIVRFDNGTDDEAFVYAEVVRKHREVRRGLMYRQHLPADEGMLFLMGTEEEHTFWMKNTLIPLDIIFIGSDMKVAGIIHDAKPMDRSSRGVGKPSLYVLEVNAGWSDKHGVDAGTPVAFEHVDLP